MSGKFSNPISYEPSHRGLARAIPGSTGVVALESGPLTTLPVVARAPAVRGIADCTDQSAKSSNQDRDARKSARPLGSTPQRDVY